MKTREQLIAPFLDNVGRIATWPSKRDKQIAVLIYLAEKFQTGRDYKEKEVNEICETWHTFSDFYLLRRGLIDFKLLSRELNGARYWKNEEIV